MSLTTPFNKENRRDTFISLISNQATSISFSTWGFIESVQEEGIVSSALTIAFGTALGISIYKGTKEKYQERKANKAAKAALQQHPFPPPAPGFNA